MAGSKHSKQQVSFGYFLNNSRDMHYMFTVYLTMSHIRTPAAFSVEWLVTNELERIWKEAIVAWFKIDLLSRHLLRWPEETPVSIADLQQGIWTRYLPNTRSMSDN